MGTLTVFLGIIMVCQVILVVAIAALAFTLKKFLDTSAAPALSEVQHTVQTVNKAVDIVEDRAERIMDIGEDAARRVSGKLAATTDSVENSISVSVISVWSLIAGVAKAIEVWRGASART